MDENCEILDNISQTSTKLLEDLCAYPSLSQNSLDLMDRSLISVSEAQSLCTICSNNIVHGEPSKKRKQSDTLPLISSMAVCEDCYGLEGESLKNTPAKSKNSRTKRPLQESDALSKLLEQQEGLLKSKDTIPEAEFRRRQLLIRNRISAQISRDKKKEYIGGLESQNEQLYQENAKLQQDIEQLETENQHLKNQLTQIHLNSEESSSGAIKLAGIAFAVFLVVLVASSSTAYSATNRKLLQLESHHEAPEPIVAIRQRRLEELPSNLRSSNTYQEPCSKALVQEIRNKRAMTTFYCPDVVSFGSERNEAIENLQVLVSVENLPGFHTQSSGHMLELLCKVSSVEVIAQDS